MADPRMSLRKRSVKTKEWWMHWPWYRQRKASPSLTWAACLIGAAKEDLDIKFAQ